MVGGVLINKQNTHERGNKGMKPIAHYTNLNEVERLIGLSYETLGMLSLSMLNETQETLYAIIWKAHTESRSSVDEENLGDEITITVISNGEIKIHTGFVGEFQVDGKYGWHLSLTDGAGIVYQNDWDNTEDDQLLWVDINREQVKVYED